MKKYKKLPFFSLIIFFLLLTSCNKPVKTARLSESFPENHLTTKADLKFAELVKQKSNGRIKIEVFMNETIAVEQDAFHMVREGTLEFARTHIGVASDYSEYPNILLFPFLFENKEHLWAVLDSPIGQDFYDDLKNCGVEPLSFYDNGVRCIYTKTPVSSLADLEGLKFRVFNSEMLEDAFYRLGTNPVPLSFNEVAHALETGIIDGAENNLPGYYSMGHSSIAKYFLNDGHIIMPDLLYASKAFMDSLDSDEKIIIMEAAREASEYQRAEWASYEEDIYKILMTEGCVFTEPDNIEEFRKVSEELLIEDYPQYIDIIRKIKDFDY